MDPSAATTALRRARDHLLEHREDRDGALAGFAPLDLGDAFNWALDWFDVVAAEHPDRPALHVVQEGGPEQRLTYAELAARSGQVAAWLRAQGVQRGDRVVVLLGNQVELWETTLAVMKLGAVIIPSTPQLPAADLRDRIARGEARHVVATAAATGTFADVPGDYTRISVGDAVDGWRDYDEAATVTEPFGADGVTRPDDTLLLYFTSGTTSRPKLVEHTQSSYPVGHLSTMFWIGLQPGDVHLNIGSPGWAKHAWSNVFAPWLAEATVFVHSADRFDATALLRQVHRHGVTTLCAPPTVWRMLVQADLSGGPGSLREVVAAGEPLNPEVIEQVRRHWGLTIRDGYGQTETTALVGNPPGQRLKPGSMGRPLPGYTVRLLEPLTGEPGEEGEICLDLAQRPVGLMVGYRDDEERTADVLHDGYYHTGDVASVDSEGYITYVGRTDDVFKASDYRISPFELESVLLEHEAVAEAAVVPSPDPLRLNVPKAYVVLAAGVEPDRETALAVLRHGREHLAPYKRIRRLQFAELPKTVSGKIRRVELRAQEQQAQTDREAADEAGSGGAGSGSGGGSVATVEWREEDFPELRG